MNETHARLAKEDLEQKPAPQQDWNKLEKDAKTFVSEFVEIEKDIDALAKKIDRLINSQAAKLYQTAPKTESVYFDSPLRPMALENFVKMQFRKSGFKFVQMGQGTIAEVKVQPLSESIKDSVKWLFKLKP